MAIITLSVTAWSQGVGINETGANPNPSAILDVESSNKGFLPPRLTTSQRDAIINPADGLIIFNTTTNCLQWYIGASIWHDACAPNLYQQYPVGSNFCNVQPTAIVDVTNPVTGRTWMDRNLGANRAATSSTDQQSYGWLYQWGRGSDGHQCVHRYVGDGVVSSSTTLVNETVSTDSPPHSNFILTNTGTNDWRTPRNDNLWQGINGINNPCPIGYRIPTLSELDQERLSWTAPPINSTNNATGAYASPLKLPMAGYRYHSSGAVDNSNISGHYWSSSTVNITEARQIYFFNSFADIGGGSRAVALSIRCIKN